MALKSPLPVYVPTGLSRMEYKAADADAVLDGA